MIAVTHPGKIGDFGLCLPICSWLHKTYNEKIIFILPKGFPFMHSAESLIRLQPFTEDIIYCDFKVQHYDLGGQPYKFNPHDYVKDLNITRYYNFGFRGQPDKFVTEYYAEEHGLGIDYDYILNLDLQFNYDRTDFMCSELLTEYYPNYKQLDFTKDFLTNLRDLANAKERHVHFSSLAVFLSLAKIPFYLYTIQRFQPFVDKLDYQYKTSIEPDTFWGYFKNAPVLDIRKLNEENKIVSIYNEIFFK
jgi:hypothetical protein